MPGWVPDEAVRNRILAENAWPLYDIPPARRGG
jgi:hypothetical protein